jgi:broad specificity phosphatase PhoE
VPDPHPASATAPLCRPVGRNAPAGVNVSAVRLLLLARHGESLFNVAGVVNADPALDRGLSETGRAEARALGAQIAGVEIDLVVTSRFPRAQETASIALGDRTVPRIVMADLDDVRIGDLEGKTLADYRSWKHGHTRSEPFPGGESLNEAAARYATAYRALLERPEPVIFTVCHEIPVRYAVNTAAGSQDLDAPVHDVRNAVPYIFGDRELAIAAAGISRLAEGGA